MNFSHFWTFSGEVLGVSERGSLRPLWLIAWFSFVDTKPCKYLFRTDQNRPSKWWNLTKNGRFSTPTSSLQVLYKNGLYYDSLYAELSDLSEPLQNLVKKGLKSVQNERFLMILRQVPATTPQPSLSTVSISYTLAEIAPRAFQNLQKQPKFSENRRFLQEFTRSRQASGQNSHPR
jgi:hypothetical protein